MALPSRLRLILLSLPLMLANQKDRHSRRMGPSLICVDDKPQVMQLHLPVRILQLLHDWEEYPHPSPALRLYLQSGGFLHVCDNYGMDPFIRREIKKVFPELSFTEVPYSHPIFHQQFDFPQGLPKVHEHDGKPPKGYGLFLEGRLICFYDYECDLGNGWEDPEVYKDAPAVRERALKMGANIVKYAFTGEK